MQKLTADQEKYVWNYICHHMQVDDRNPSDVIAEDFGGDQSHYLEIMAGWHSISFCSFCGKVNKNDLLVFETDVDGSGKNLCSVCQAEFSIWKFANPQGNMEDFAMFKQVLHRCPFAQAG